MYYSLRKDNAVRLANIIIYSIIISVNPRLIIIMFCICSKLTDPVSNRTNKVNCTSSIFELANM